MTVTGNGRPCWSNIPLIRSRFKRIRSQQVSEKKRSNKVEFTMDEALLRGFDKGSISVPVGSKTYF